MQAHMTASLVIAALQQAVTHRKPSGSLIHHSDQGSRTTGYFTEHEWDWKLL